MSGGGKGGVYVPWDDDKIGPHVIVRIEGKLTEAEWEEFKECVDKFVKKFAKRIKVKVVKVD